MLRRLATEESVGNWYSKRQETNIQNPHTRHRPTLSVRIIWIVKGKRKETTMTKEDMRNILDELDNLTLGLNTAENALDATFHFFNKNISTKEKTMLLTLEYDTQSAIFNLAYDCLIKTRESLNDAIGMYQRELEQEKDENR